MRILDLTANNAAGIEQAAALLVEGFRDSGSTAWRELPAALAEVRGFFQPGRICRIAVDDAGSVIGWIGGIETYDGHVWELHPLVVKEGVRGRGVGRALVQDFEEQVRRRGANTIQLGTDDENGRTTLGGVDLYPDVLERVQQIRSLGRHPFEFYQKVGFTIVGVVPDANGPGKPDIWMAKRVI